MGLGETYEARYGKIDARLGPALFVLGDFSLVAGSSKPQDHHSSWTLRTIDLWEAEDKYKRTRYVLLESRPGEKGSGRK